MLLIKRMEKKSSALLGFGRLVIKEKSNTLLGERKMTDDKTKQKDSRIENISSEEAQKVVGGAAGVNATVASVAGKISTDAVASAQKTQAGVVNESTTSKFVMSAYTSDAKKKQ